MNVVTKFDIKLGIRRVERAIELCRDDLEDAECESIEDVIASCEAREAELLVLLDALRTQLAEWLPVGSLRLHYIDKPTIVRDEHDKLRYSDKDYEVLVLGDGKVYGCEDHVPHPDSQLVYLNDIHFIDM